MDVYNSSERFRMVAEVMKMSDKERKFLRQSKWKRLTRQRWFYPTLYIGLVAVVLAGVMIYQFNAADDTAEENANDYSWNVEQNDLIENSEENAAEVVAEQEDLVMPVMLGDKTEILTQYYDADAAEEDQLDALIFYNNQYYQSKGVDITSSDGEPFEVIASLTGKVTSVKDDELLGKVVEMEHDGERATMYGSLSEVYVSEGDELTQGDPLGLSGANVYTDEEISKVHFRLMEEGQPVNPGFK